MACPQVDILINNAGGPPPGDFRDWQREDWLKALDANMLTPIELIKACVDGMAERGFGRIVNITSGAVKAPIDVLGLSNGARSGLTGFIAGLARQSRLAGQQRNDQQSPAWPIRDRALAQNPDRCRRGQWRQRGAASANSGAKHVPAQRFRPAGRVRRLLRIHLQRPRRLPHRAKPVAGRWKLPRYVLIAAHRAQALDNLMANVDGRVISPSCNDSVYWPGRSWSEGGLARSSDKPAWHRNIPARHPYENPAIGSGTNP